MRASEMDLETVELFELKLSVSRRQLLGSAAASFTLACSPAMSAPRLNLQGLYEEPWFLPTGGDLAKDFAASANLKKTFTVFWEMRGCPWCKLLHMENFAQDRIVNYMRENFAVVQLNLRGARQITDFDGEKLPEEFLSMKHEVNSTPTIQFFLPSDASKPRELGRIGYLKPDEFLLMLRFVHEKGYADGSYEDWAKKHGKGA